MPAQTDIPILADVTAQADMCTLADVPSQFVAHGRRDVPTQGDYEAVAKYTRSTSTRSSTRPVYKPRHSPTIKLAKELLSTQRSLEVARAAAKIPVAAVTTHEVVFDVLAPMAVTPVTFSEAALVTSEPNVVIVTGLGTGAIPSTSVMMHGMATPQRSPTIGLISSHKFNPDIFFSTYFYFHPYVMGCISDVSALFCL